MLSQDCLQRHIALTTKKNKESKMSFCVVVVILQIHIVCDSDMREQKLCVAPGSMYITKLLVGGIW